MIIIIICLFSPGSSDGEESSAALSASPPVHLNLSSSYNERQMHGAGVGNPSSTHSR